MMMLTSNHHGFDIYNEHIIELTEEERALIIATTDGLPSIDVSCVDDYLLTEAELRSRHLPDRLAQHLIHFRKHSNDYGMVLIRNLPIDTNLPPTPSDGRVSLSKTTHRSEYVLFEVMFYLGDPIAYLDEKNGALIQDICPVQGREEAQENTGSVYLEFHTEDAFHPHKPDYVSLFCLRPDHEHIAATAVASIRRALSMVPEHIQTLLRQPLYRIHLSSSFMSDTQEKLFSSPLAVLSGDRFEPELVVDFYGMEALNAESEAALKILEAALMKVAVEYKLIAGDLIIVDNRVAAHARTAFQPHYDGLDRWLQRLFVVRDFHQSRANRSQYSHICAPLRHILYSETRGCVPSKMSTESLGREKPKTS
jgi:L-asparagine oxygenase